MQGEVSNFLAAIDAMVQRGFLKRAFEDPLLPSEHYGMLGDREPIDVKIGNTITDTRPGFLVPRPTSVDPSQATGQDNGIVPDQFTIEQFSLMLERHEGTQDLNTRTEPLGAITQFPQVVRGMLQQAKSSIDTWKRDIVLGGNVPYLASAAAPQGVIRLVTGYASGTSIVTAATANANTVHLDDISGFTQVLVNGVPTAVSGATPLPLIQNGVVVAEITGFAVDGFANGLWGTSLRRSTNSQACGASGTLTLAANASFAAGAVVTTPNAPLIIRPNGKQHFSQLTSSDTLVASMIREATAYLGDNSVPPHAEGLYAALGDRIGFSQLWADPEMQNYAKTRLKSSFVRNAELDVVMDAMLVPTTNTPYQPASATLGVGVRRIVIAGQKVLRIGPSKANERFAAIARTNNGLAEQHPNHWIGYWDDMTYAIRGPQDRQGETISLSWNSMNSATNPTDSTASSAITSTWSNAALKRAVVLEFAG